jgi:hypothetical protein
LSEGANSSLESEKLEFSSITNAVSMNNNTEQLLQNIIVIKKRLEANPDIFLTTTIDLRQSDFFLIGQLIQLYCFADLNARRIIDTLRHAAFGAEARNASRLQDAQVFPKLREIVAELWDSNLKEGLRKAADTIEMHRTLRHTFAHWAARRIENEDALVLFTKNAREAERRDGDPQHPDELKYAIVPLASFPEEIRKLDGHTKYLAESAAHVEHYFDDFRQKFAERRT